MVKNTTGGNQAKNIARKNAYKTNTQLMLPTSPLEVIVCVTKAFGNGMLQVQTDDNKILLAHIRNKFRGKQKRHNLITVNSVVLVGLREWENPAKNCDIIFIYDPNHVEQLKNIPSLEIKNIIKLSMGQLFLSKELLANDIVFTEETEEEIKDTEEYTKSLKKHEFKMEDTEEIDFDDI
jgi:initiation factor 1A